MKKIIALLLVLLLVFSFSACKKTETQEDEDEPEILLDDDENCFIPGQESEIGLYTAQHFLESGYGCFNDDTGMYITYTYIKDSNYNDADCYIFDAKQSADPKGEFTHFAYFAVEKQGAFISEYKE